MMANDTEALFVGEKTPEPMPSSEKPVETPVKTQEPVKQEPETADSLPEDVKSRTAEQFSKLKEQLKQERERRLEAESYAKARETYQAPSSLPEEEDPIYDPSSGYVDVGKLEKIRSDAKDARKEAAEAKRSFEKYLQEQQEREAYDAYPILNPKHEEFDQKFFNVTRALLTDSMLNPKDYGGKTLTAKDAAKLAYEATMKIVETAKQEATKEVVEKLTEKEQASLEAVGNSSNRDDDSEKIEDLKNRSRFGDKKAIVERLRNLK
jgi:hypothetical protein